MQTTEAGNEKKFYDTMARHRMNDMLDEDTAFVTTETLHSAIFDPDGIIGPNDEAPKEYVLYNQTKVNREDARAVMSDAHVDIAQSIAEVDGPHKAVAAFKSFIYITTGLRPWIAAVPPNRNDDTRRFETLVQSFYYAATPYLGTYVSENDTDISQDPITYANELRDETEKDAFISSYTYENLKAICEVITDSVDVEHIDQVTRRRHVNLIENGNLATAFSIPWDPR